MPFPEGLPRDLEEQLKEANTPIAHSLQEFNGLFEQIPSSRNRPWLGSAGQRVQNMLEGWIGTKVDSWKLLVGVAVLDIASGSSSHPARRASSVPPYFARLCAINSAEVVAMDLYRPSDLDSALFTNITTNIVIAVLEGQLLRLPSLVGRKFNIINSTHFVGCIPDFNIFDYVPWELMKQFNLSKSNRGVRNFEQILLQQCSGLLKEGGFLDLDLEVPDRLASQPYRMMNGQLVPIPVP